jgi:capsular exopolysaccharide synthesis family protein
VRAKPSEVVITESQDLAEFEPGSSGGLSGQHIVGAMRRWWRVVIPVGMLLGIIAGLAVFLVFDPVYQSTAWLKIQSSPNYIVFEEKQTEKDALRFIETQVQLLRSPMVLAPVVAEQDVAALTEIQKVDDPITWLAGHIDISQMGDSELFRISFPSAIPETSSTIVNAVASSYLNFHAKQENETRRRVLSLLRREKDKYIAIIKQLQTNLRSLTTRMAEGSGNSQLSMQADEPSPMIDQLIKRSVDLELAELALRARLEVEEDEDETRLPRHSDLLTDTTAIDNDPHIVAQQSDLAMIHSQLEDLRMRMRRPESNIRFRELSKLASQRAATLQQTKNALHATFRDKNRRQQNGSLQDGDETMDTGAEVEAQLAVVMLQKTHLQKQLDREFEKMRAGAPDRMEAEFLRAELSMAEDMQSEISSRVSQLQVESQSVDRVQLLKPAEVERLPVENVPMKKMLAASFGATLLPVAIAVFWERLSHRVCDSRSLAKKVPLALLGEITRLPITTTGGGRRKQRRLDEEMRMFEETMNGLATTLRLSENLQNVRVLAITSAVKNEGKTSLASQLAICIADTTNEPTLLIDGDMRSPDIHNVFDLDWEPGLADVLEQSCKLEDAICPTDNANLYVLPAGRLTTSPLKLLKDFHSTVLDRVDSRFRHIVIDTPPILSASEALCLAKSADATLICAMLDVSRSDQLTEAHRRLQTAGARPIGFALNGVPYKSYLRKYGYYSIAEEPPA